MGVYLYPSNTETPLKDAYIGIPNPTSIVLDKNSIILTTIGDTEQLTATIEPTISDHSITWSSDDTTVATVSTSGLVTCVTPGSCTITATTVNGLTASCSVDKSRIPSIYQEVEWIQTTGTQWINTGVFAYNSYQTEAKIEVTTTSQALPVFGCYKSGGDISGYYHLTCYNNKWYFGKNGSEGNGGTYSPIVGTQYTIIYNNSNSQLNLNGTDVASTSGTVGATGSTLGMAIRGNGNYYGKYKYFYFKIYNKSDNEYVCDSVPCYRIADSVIGMYDVVNNQFLTNAGSGTFTKGPDVN